MPGITRKSAHDFLRILHLSDLHFTTESKVSEFLQRLEQDLRGKELKIDRLDYLVVSGDFTNKCNLSAFPIVEQFLQQLMADFSVGPERVILTPGNHDYQQNVAKDFTTQVWKEGMAVPLNSHREGKLLLTQNEHYLHRFDGYSEFYKSFYKGQRKYPLEPEKQFDIFDFPETGLTFLGLNSAWRIDYYHQKRAEINPTAVSEALLKKPNARLGIVVWHHAVTGDRPIADKKIMETLALAGYRILLHGDVHEERDEIVNHLYKELRFHIVGSGTFGASSHDRPESTPRLYTLLEVKRDLSDVLVRRRKQSTATAAFEPHYVHGKKQYHIALPPTLHTAGKQHGKNQRLSADPAAQLLHDYLVAEINQHASIQLPVISQHGQAVTAPINDLRVDLPLQVSHRHAPIDPDTKPQPNTHQVASINDQLRSHTGNLLGARKSQRADIREQTTITRELRPGCRLVIVGDPGCGKSTLLQWITHYYASAFGRQSDADSCATIDPLPKQNLVPILILCDDLAGHPLPSCLEDLLRLHLKRKQFSEIKTEGLISRFEQLMDQKQSILLFDGLDRIPGFARRLEFCKLLTSIACRFPESSIVVTSRVIGFQEVCHELAPQYDHLVVDHLLPQAKQDFIERWSKLIHWEAAKVANLVSDVCNNRFTASLTDNILLLAMVAQIRVMDSKLPDRRIDVYRRAVQLMIQRCRPFPGTPLSTNELIPHLEFLAYRMQKNSLQRCNEKEVVAAFRELRAREADESVLQNRTPEELLRACIDSIDLLNEAGPQIDSKGFERQMIQFFHQSFQEYFAGQAIIHGRDTSGQDGPVASLRSLLSNAKVREREVNVWNEYKVSEPVLEADSQKTVSMAIADLKPEEADDAITMLLSDSTRHPNEDRAWAVFALQCLAEEPKVNKNTVEAVFRAAIDCLREGDGVGSEIHTWMDEALAAIAESAFGIPIRDRFVEGYISSRGDQRERIGCCVCVRSSSDSAAVTSENAEDLITKANIGLSSEKQMERALTALELMNRFFISRGKLTFLQLAQQNRLVEMLMRAVFEDEASESAAMWALMWLTGARERTPGNTLSEPSSPHPAEEFIHLGSLEIGKLEKILQRPYIDPNTLAYGSLVLTREKGLNLVVHQLDWIYELAVIADGARPRRGLQLPASTGRLASNQWMLDLLVNGLPPRAASRVAEALGSFGVYDSRMVKPLEFMFTSKKLGNYERDEAVIYLAFIGTPEATNILIKAADTPPPTEKEDYFYSRGLLGLLLLDNVDALAEQISKALPHSDLNAYAYGLAGSRDPRGLVLLEQFRNNPDERIRTAVEKAFARSWMSATSATSGTEPAPPQKKEA